MHYYMLQRKSNVANHVRRYTIIGKLYMIYTFLIEEKNKYD